jgi:signal transduction histidine kinase
MNGAEELRQRRGRAGAIAVPAAAFAADYLICVDWSYVGAAERPAMLATGLALYMAGGSTALWWRHNRPFQVHVAVVAWATAGIILLPVAPIASLLVALFGVAARSPRRTALAGAALAAVPMGLDIAQNLKQDGGDFSTSRAAVVAGSYAGAFSVVWIVGRILRRREHRVQVLEEDLDARARAAVVEERRRLARDLHDIVSHAVSVMVIQAAAARRQCTAGDDDDAAEAFANIEDRGREAMVELRRLLNVMRDDDQIPFNEDGQRRLAELPTLIRSVESAGVHVTVATHGTPERLDASIDLTAFRVVQEALTNTTKHAGPGTRAQINLQWGNDLVIDITDTGTTDPSLDARVLSTGAGLAGMSERVRSLGGHLDAAPRDDAPGFRLRAVLPLARYNLPYDEHELM